MNPKLIALIIFAALLAVLAVPFIRHGKTGLRLRAAASLFVGGLRGEFATANTEGAAGTHKVLNLRADAAHSYTHLLIKTGSDSFHGAVTSATSSYPIGTTTDAPDGAEDVLHVTPLGIGEDTRKVRVATAIAKDVDLYVAANGFASALPAAAGTYYRIGRTVALAVQIGSGDYLAEFVPCAPVKVIVIVAATGTAATDIAALFTAMQSGPAEIKAL